jgi:hypothetical protein
MDSKEEFNSLKFELTPLQALFLKENMNLRKSTATTFQVYHNDYQIRCMVVIDQSRAHQRVL